MKAKAVFQFSALLSARVRERWPAFCFCQKAALCCGCASCALSWGKADLRRTAETALARTIRSLRGALDLGSLRRPSRPPAVEIPIHFVESDICTLCTYTDCTDCILNSVVSRWCRLISFVGGSVDGPPRSSFECANLRQLDWGAEVVFARTF